jgi:hypothetical protein
MREVQELSPSEKTASSSLQTLLLISVETVTRIQREDTSHMSISFKVVSQVNKLK